MTSKNTMQQLLRDAEDVAQRRGCTEDEALREVVSGTNGISVEEVAEYRRELDDTYERDADQRRALEDDFDRGMSL